MTGIVKGQRRDVAKTKTHVSFHVFFLDLMSYFFKQNYTSADNYVKQKTHFFLASTHLTLTALSNEWRPSMH